MWGGRGGRGGRGACACGGGGGWGGGGGVILGEVKARPKDIISFSLDYISKSKVQTSNPSSSPISLDTPARPADSAQIYTPGISPKPTLQASSSYVTSWKRTFFFRGQFETIEAMDSMKLQLHAGLPGVVRRCT